MDYKLKNKAKFGVAPSGVLGKTSRKAALSRDLKLGMVSIETVFKNNRKAKGK